MKNNAELKALAWKRLWADHWFGRLFGGMILLGVVGYAVQGVLGGILEGFGVMSWPDYLQLLVVHRADATISVPELTSEFISRATSSTVLTLFISFIMSGIAAYGSAVILKRCLANDEKGWLGAAFGGFAAPFGMLALFLLLWFIWIGYTLLASALPALLFVFCFGSLERMLSPGMDLVVGVGAALCLSLAILVLCIPFYRYRFVWLVKVDHPDWGALQCLRSCRELMTGNLMKSFRLDCAYWLPITLLLLLVLVPLAAVAVGYTIGSKALIVLGTLMCVAAGVPAGWVVSAYVRVGQGFLYEELKAARVTGA